MQIAVIEFARNVGGLKEANSAEFDANSPHPSHPYHGRAKSIENERWQHASRGL